MKRPKATGQLNFGKTPEIQRKNIEMKFMSKSLKGMEKINYSLNIKEKKKQSNMYDNKYGTCQIFSQCCFKININYNKIIVAIVFQYEGNISV